MIIDLSAVETTTMPLGLYFFIRNKSNGLVLEIPEMAADGACSVQTGSQIDSSSINEHQLWHHDVPTKTIRNKSNGLCMDISDVSGSILVNPYQSRSFTQQWLLMEGRLQLKDDFETVVTIADDSMHPGCDVISATDEGKSGQQWEFVHIEAEYFYIVNSETDQVMDVAGNDVRPGAKVIVYGRKEAPQNNQLWYQDSQGIIHSKLNDFVLTAHDGRIVLRMYNQTDINQKWALRGNRIVNALQPDQVLDIKPKMFSNSKVIPNGAADVTSQEWFFEYLPDQTTAFSHSGCGRYSFIACYLNQSLVLTLKNGERMAGTCVVLEEMCDVFSGGKCVNQLWYLDERSGTVRSDANGYAMDIENGRLVVNPCDPKCQTQKWRYTRDDKKFHYRYNYVRVLQVQDYIFEPGNGLTTALNVPKDALKLIMKHIKAEHFYIQSASCDKVVAVKDGDADAGTPVILATKLASSSPHQLWYEDEHGLIRSVLNGYVFCAQEKDYVKMMPLNATVTAYHWVLYGKDMILNRFNSDLVLDVAGATTDEGSKLCAWAKHGGPNQRWKIVYTRRITDGVDQPCCGVCRGRQEPQ